MVFQIKEFKQIKTTSIMKTMKRFEAFYKDDSKNNHMYQDGEVYATEVRFNIIARDEERAMELIESEGEDPYNFYLEQVSGVKDQMGKYFPENIRDARIK